jgi:hypothetical protein
MFCEVRGLELTSQNRRKEREGDIEEDRRRRSLYAHVLGIRRH